MITWESAGHFFATAWHDICVAGRAVANHNQQIQQVGLKVEEITAAVAVIPAIAPEALLVLEIERISMFGLGIICQIILDHDHNLDAAAKANPGIHPNLWQQAAQLLTQYPQLVAQAKTLVTK